MEGRLTRALGGLFDSFASQAGSNACAQGSGGAAHHAPELICILGWAVLILQMLPAQIQRAGVSHNMLPELAASSPSLPPTTPPASSRPLLPNFSLFCSPQHSAQAQQSCKGPAMAVFAQEHHLKGGQVAGHQMVIL